MPSEMPLALFSTRRFFWHVFFRWQWPLRDLSMIFMPRGLKRSFRSAMGEMWKSLLQNV